MSLPQLSTRLRIELIEMTSRAEVGYLGGCLSCLEILIALYFGKIDNQPVLKYDSKKPGWNQQDIFVLSKAHAAAALYVTLAEAGFFPKEELMHFTKSGAMLKYHPSLKIRGIGAVSGAPGEGLSVANGFAMGYKLDKAENRVYALLGDGELQEGQIWEAAMTAAHYKLDNLCAIIDCNEMQRDDYIKGIKNIEPIQDKFESFGWKVLNILDGHNFDDLLQAFKKARSTEKQPSLIIAPTIKGKGIGFTEKRSFYHNSFLSPQESAIALEELRQNL